MTPNETQTRKQLIDGQIAKTGWNLFDRHQVRFEVPASGDDDDWTDGITDYSLYLETGEIIAVVEAKRQSRSPQVAREQAKLYATRIEQNQSFRPFVFLANGLEIWFWDTEDETPRIALETEEQLLADLAEKISPLQKEIDQLGNQFWVAKADVQANKYDLSASRYRQIEADETFYEEPNFTLERLDLLENVMIGETKELAKMLM